MDVVSLTVSLTRYIKMAIGQGNGLRRTADNRTPSLQNHPPKCSLVTSFLSVQNQRDGQRHDCHIDTGHRAKRADVSGLYPRINTMKEAESYDVLYETISGEFLLEVRRSLCGIPSGRSQAAAHPH